MGRARTFGTIFIRVLVALAIVAAQALLASAVIALVVWLYLLSPLAGAAAGIVVLAFAGWRGYSGMAKDERNQASPPLI